MNHKQVRNSTQPAFTCSKLTIEIPEQGVEYVQSWLVEKVTKEKVLKKFPEMENSFSFDIP